MKLPLQVEAIIYQQVPVNESDNLQGERSLLFLALHRTPERGGFWQPLTGGVEDTDASLESAVVREVFEELGIDESGILALRALNYQFSFMGEDGMELTERAYAVEIDNSRGVVLSDEHDAMHWGPSSEVSDLFKWQDNKNALKELIETVVS